MSPRKIKTRSAVIQIDGDIVVKRYRASNKHLYHNECLWLKSLASAAFTPKIISCSDEDLSLTMKYCGEPISSDNAPADWDRQIRSILLTLSAADCHHGDLLQQNILVHNSMLYVIDFATACSPRTTAAKKKRTYADAYTESRLRYFLEAIDPGTEIHLFVVWSTKHVQSVESQIGKKLRLIDKISFTPHLYGDYGMDRISWLKRFYNAPYLLGSPKGKLPFCAFIVSSSRGDYEPRRRVFSNEWRIVKSDIFDLKFELRAGREGYLHSSDNLEEVRRNLKWLAYDNESLPYRYVTRARPQFASLSHAFEALNKLPNTKYVLMRRPAVENTDGAEDYDILCDNFFVVKRALGGVAYKTHSSKLFQNVGMAYDEGGYKVANHVSIDGRKVPFDIRYVGDGYYPTSWQRRMLERRVFENGAYVCAPEDEYFGKAYHALFHKIELPKKYLDYFGSRLHVTNAAELRTKLLQVTREYLDEKSYVITRPKDFTIPFNGLARKKYAATREVYLARREVRAANYSGASKVMLNYIKLFRRPIFGGSVLLFILYRWLRADICDYLMTRKRELRRKLKHLRLRILVGSLTATPALNKSAAMMTQNLEKPDLAAMERLSKKHHA